MSTGTRFQVPALKAKHEGMAGTSAGLSLAENEKQHILWALDKTSWKISGPGGAAELLDINYGTLRSRMAKHGIKKKTQAAEA